MKVDMSKKIVKISRNFNKNAEEISELIIDALLKSSSIPQLAADDFLVRIHMIVREKLEN